MEEEPKLPPVRILVCGDVDGKFRKIFSKVASVNKSSGPYEMFVCVGSFFGDNNDEWSEVKSGEIEVPVNTYILGPCKPEHEKFYFDMNGQEVSPNIIYLGKRGILTGTSGLKVAYLSGVEGTTTANYTFTSADIISLQNQYEAGAFKGIDILFTSQWPKGATKFTTIAENEEYLSGSELISHLVTVLKPRYHFAGLKGISYERLPYRNYQVLLEPTNYCTRFISLAKVGNIGKRKMLYAFNLLPLTAMTSDTIRRMHAGVVTECPYRHLPVKQAALPSSKPTQYFFDQKSASNDNKHKCYDSSGSGIPVKRQCKEACWFCLSSEDVKKHLLISVGKRSYVALAKGGLVPEHVLLIPNSHFGSSIVLPDDVANEMRSFKIALSKLFFSNNRDIVFFERNFCSPHLHIQALPVPKNTAVRMKNVLEHLSAGLDLKWLEVPPEKDPSQCMERNFSFFSIEVLSENQIYSKKFLTIIKEGKFPLQFGRQVVADQKILNIPDSETWKDCQLSKEQETEFVDSFKEAFKIYDFTVPVKHYPRF